MIHIIDVQNNTLACEFVENEDEDELFIIVLEHVFSESFKVISGGKSVNLVISKVEAENSFTLIQIPTFTVEYCKRKVPQHCMFLSH